MAAVGATPATLGLTNAELNTFTAQRLVIGSATAGNVSVSSAITTNASTGHITLLSGRDIAINGALNTGARNLTLDAQGGSSLVTQTAALTTAGLELLGANASHTLTNASNAIASVAGNTGAVTLTNNTQLSIASVNNTSGLFTSGDISVTSTTSTLDHSGIWTTQAVRTTGGTVSLTGSNTASAGTSAASFGIRIGNSQSIGDANTGAISIHGTSTLDTGVFVGSGLSVSSKRLVSVTGHGVTGINIAGAVTSLSGGADFAGAQSVVITGTGASAANGVVLGGSVLNNSTGGASSIRSTQGALYMNGVVTHASTAADVVMAAGDGTTGSSAQVVSTAASLITQNADAHVFMSSDGQGNVTPARVVKNGTGGGDIVLAAGRLLAAGTGSGGQVTPLAGNTVVNNGTGKTFVYSGNPLVTGDLTIVSPSLANMDLEEGLGGVGSQQNAQTNTAYDSGSLGISDSSASAQALFRSKVAFNGTLTGVTLNRTYGAADTRLAAVADLWTDVRAQLKLANTGNMTLSGAGGTLRLSKASIIDGIAPTTLQSTSFSAANYLNTNSSGYHFAALGASVTPATWTNTGLVSVVVDKANATVTANSATVTYNGQSQSVTGFSATGLVGGETESVLSGVSTSGGSGRNAGSYTHTASGTDGNYNLSFVDGTLTIDKANASVSGTATNVTYNGQTQAQSAPSSSGFVAGDAISISGAASGKNAGTYSSALSVGGADADNYNVTVNNADLVIDKADATVTANSATVTYNGQSQSVTGFSATGLVGGETESVLSGVSTSGGSGRNAGSYTHTASGTDGNYNLSFVDGTLTIDKANASVSGTATNVTYNGQTQAQSAPSSSGFVAGDAISISGAASGKNAGTYSSALSVGGADADNYNVTVNNADLVIDQAPLTVTATGVSKIYDGGVAAAGSATVGALAGAAAGEEVDSHGSQVFLNKDAGTGKTVRASGVTVKDAGGNNVTGNYAITYVDDSNSIIEQAPLTVIANNDARFVTLNDTPGYNGVSFTGFVGGETESVLSGALTLNRTNALSDVDAGTYRGVLVPGGLTSGNYSIRFVNGDYTIVPANRLLIRTTNVNAIYGSAPSYTATAQYLDGTSNLIHTLTRSGSNGDFTFNDGANGSVTVSLGAYSGGVAASTSTSGHTVVGNYDILDTNPVIRGANFVGAPVFTGSLSVAPKAVTPSTTGVSKTYDGTTSMSNVVVGMSGAVAGDRLSISGTGAFSQKHVGTGLGYTISGVALSGEDAANYYLSGGTNSFAGNDGVIVAAPLVISTTNISKVYDRTTTANGAAVAVQGTQLFNGDTFSGGAYSFTDAEAGLGNKVVVVSGVTVNDGNGGANYSISFVNNTTSTIRPKALTVGFAPITRVYDGSAVAQVIGQSDDVIAGDAVTFTHSSASFADKHVGEGKTVLVSGIAISGADAANYSLQNTSATSVGGIVRRDVSLLAVTADNKVYDGNTVAAISSGEIAGVAAGETLDVRGEGSFDTPHVGTGKTVTVADVTTLTKVNGTGDWSNYNLVTTGSLSTLGAASIEPRTIQVTGTRVADKPFDGRVLAVVSQAGTPQGLVAGEDLVLSAQAAFVDAQPGTAKPVMVSYAIADGVAGLASNYRVVTNGAQARAAIWPLATNTADTLAPVSPEPVGRQRVAVAGGANIGQAQGRFTDRWLPLVCRPADQDTLGAGISVEICTGDQ